LYEANVSQHILEVAFLTVFLGAAFVPKIRYNALLKLEKFSFDRHKGYQQI
jgi:hypothetical protein